MQSFLQVHGRRIAALLAILILYSLARLPRLPEDERRLLAERFRFTRFTLPEPSGITPRSVRTVHPDFQHIAAWISTVGAAVALNDLDGDGLSNDVCHVDPRFDRVMVAPAPGTGRRYEPFVLLPAPLPYDAQTMAPMGCVPGDLNEDGLMDILVYYWGRAPVAFLRKDTSAARPPDAVAYAPCEIMPDGGRWYTNGLTMADLDGDTHADLVIGNYFPDGARVLDRRGGGHEQMQDSMSRAYNGGRNRILLWRGAGGGDAPSVSFEEIEGVFDEDVAHGWTLGVGAADLDGDLLPEIYFAHDFGPDRLLHNRSAPGRVRFAILDGVKTLTMPNSKVLGRDSFKGMGVDFGDLNGDGWLDIYVSNIADEYALEESHLAFISTGRVEQMAAGVAPYVDESEGWGLSRSGWGWETRFGDFDNDGDLEVLQATGFVKGDADRWPELHELAMSNDFWVHQPAAWPNFLPGADLSGHETNPFFVRASDGRFYDIAMDLGLGEYEVSRGIATADVDGDGDLDFAVANQWEPSRFYRNDSPNPGASLVLRLLLPTGYSASAETRVVSSPTADVTQGRAAIGATARVLLPDGRRLVAQVDGGNGHSGARSHELHFGLGHLSPGATVRVEVRWRDGGDEIRRETFDFPPGRHCLVLGRSGAAR